MLSWLGKQVISHNMKRLRAGDAAPTLRTRAQTTSGWCSPAPAALPSTCAARQSTSSGFARFTRLGIQIFPDEVMVKGFPWNATVCVRGHDHARQSPGRARL